MKVFTEADLWGLVLRADSLEKVSEAERFLSRLVFSPQMEDADLPGALMDALGAIRERLEDREMYGPSCPWNAPGMRVSDFVRGVCD